MAQKTIVQLIDDLDGTTSDAIETIAFGLDGVTYEIDLSDANAAKLRDDLASFVASAAVSVAVRSTAQLPPLVDRLAATAPAGLANRPKPFVSGPETTVGTSPTVVESQRTSSRRLKDRRGRPAARRRNSSRARWAGHDTQPHWHVIRRHYADGLYDAAPGHRCGGAVTSLEGPVAGWTLAKLGPLGRWVAQQMRRDHQPIMGRKASPAHDYDAFYLFVAVAPSDTPQSRSSLDFIDAAHRFVSDGLPSMFTGKAEYSGGELVRFRQPVGDPLAAKNSIMLSPSGLVELQYSLAVPPETTTLQLGEIMTVISRLHELVCSDAYPSLYRSRRLERWRGVDWRIGVNSRAVPHNGGNTISWTELVAPVSLPSDRIDDPRPYCPTEGYGAAPLTTVRRSSRPENVLAPVLEGLLSAAGYTNAMEIRNCVGELLRTPSLST